jgi:hypothetical protein
MTVKLPYYPLMAMNGHYSRLYKRLKKAFIENLATIKCHKWIERKGTNDRTIISLNNGISIDMPFDMNANDIKIIRHYLEGLKMSIKE